uniref:Uncharacterized protein n=1 Tax=Helianthus annuus TaxID=4232 RepID=A0A251UX72_HELAN
MAISMPRIIQAKKILRRSLSNGSRTPTYTDIPKGYFCDKRQNSVLSRNEPRTRNRIEICTERKSEISRRLWKNMFKWLSRTQAFVIFKQDICNVNYGFESNEISGRLWKNMFKWLSRTQAFVMSSVFDCYVLNFE